MSSLALNSLEIQNFRAFRHLSIGRLGRVNLVVGKNSVGKTTVLEALRLYADRDWPATFWDILVERDESQRLRSSVDRVNAKEIVQDIRYLFYGRDYISGHSVEVQIGPMAEPERRLSFFAQWYVNGNDENADRYLGITSQLGDGQVRIFPIDRTIGAAVPLRRRFSDVSHIFVPANGISGRDMGEWWDQTALTPQEERVNEALQLIVPGIERLSVIGSTRSRPTPIAKVKGIETPLPLRSLGEGLYRTLGIALALVNAQNGFLLVDEIESGLHYTALLGLWRLILQTARRLDVQVFATTHSWDCIEAFQQATREDHQEEGVLIRLGRKHDDIVATVFDEEELAIATRERIEVR